MALAILFLPAIIRGRVAVNADWLAHCFHPWNDASVLPRNLELDDPILNVYPLQQAAAHRLLGGEVPLWETRICAGFPLLADNTSFPFSPFRVLSLAVTFPTAFTLVPLVQLLVLGAGVYLLARDLGQRPESACIAALVATLSETCIVWAEFQFWLGAASWTPWTVLFLLRCFRSRGLISFLLGSVCIGLSFLGGQIQVAVYAVCFSLLAAAALAWFCPNGPEPVPVARIVFGLAASLVLGLCLAAVQLLPTAELLAQTSRYPDRYEGQNHIRGLELLTWLLPDLFGNPGTGDYVGGQFLATSYLGKHGGFVGTIPLILAILGVAYGRSNRSRFFAFSLLALVLGLLLLRPPVHRLLTAVLPLFGQIHHKRVLFLYALSAALLAGSGLDAFKDSPPSRQRRLLSVVFACGGLVLTLSSCLEVALIVTRALAVDQATVPLLGYLAQRQDEYGALLLWPSLGLPAAALVAGGVGLLVGHLLQAAPTEIASGRFSASLIGIRGFLRDTIGLRAARFPAAAALPAIVAAELLFFGTRYSPFVDQELVYPARSSLTWLSENLGLWRVSAIDPPTPVLSPPEREKLRRSADRELASVTHFLLRCQWKGEVLPPDTGLPYGLCDVRGKESLLTQRYRSMMQALNVPSGAPFLVTVHFQTGKSPILDLLGVRYLICPPEPCSLPAGLETIYRAEVRVLDNPGAFPRTYVVPRGRIIVAGDASGITQTIATEGVSWTKWAIVESALIDAGRSVLYTPGTSRAAQPASIVSYGAHRVLIDVPAGASGLLVLTDAYFPGWTVYRDGERAGTFPVNLLLRGTWLREGTNSAEWVYQPQSFRLGVSLTCAAMAALSVLLACVVVHRVSRSIPDSLRRCASRETELRGLLVLQETRNGDQA
jgi:hypothetical protein